MNAPKAIRVFSHQYPGQTTAAVTQLVERATAKGIEVRVNEGELRKHGLTAGDGLVVDDGDGADLAVVLGGDGTILTALRHYAEGDTPVFAFNFGAIGFLATVDPDKLDEGMERSLSGDFDVLALPALVVEVEGERHFAVNDISFHRRANNRVAELGYEVEGDRLGEVRCDGLVVSTPAGSTGYNLANGGPVLAWGVDGFVVSFIAPHTLTARTLVVATRDTLSVANLSQREEVDVLTDGRTVGAVGPGKGLDVRFEHDKALLAQLPGSSFYHRLREKFGRLAY